MTQAGLYIHIPFCQRKCKYCDFFSCAQLDLVDRYVDELCREIVLCGRRFPAEINTIYLGGGTPSVLTLGQLNKIFSAVHNAFPVHSEETTIEVNPNTSENLAEYKTFGIDRVSIGVQSLSDVLLKKIGRLHTADEALKTLENARNNFDNVSGDLIIGLDKEQDVVGDLEKIAPYCTHISAYMLSVAKKTPLYTLVKEKKFIPASDDEVVDQYEKLTDRCRELGFYRYETSNFSQLGKEGVHNGNYWEMKPYIGVGPSAHSYFNGVRYYNKNDLTAYLNGEHSGNGKEVSERKVSVRSEKTETIMLALRTTKGLDIEKYNERFSADFIKEHKNGLIKVKDYTAIKNNKLYILPKYFSVQNSIILSILTDL